MRTLGIDFGEVRIGVAISDLTRSFASPLTTLKSLNQLEAIEAIGLIVTEQDVNNVVIGVPVSLDGTVGPQARKIKRFANLLGQQLPVPVCFWDESYSSVLADNIMVSSGTRRSKKKNKRDSIAATVILQEYLDSCRHNNAVRSLTT